MFVSKEYQRFSKYYPTTKVSVFFGGLPIAKDEATLKDNCPHIVVGTPGRLLALASKKSLKLTNIKHFVLDECDQMLEKLDMRRDVQNIFRMTPHEKQVMMFSATLSKEIRPGRYLREISSTMHCISSTPERTELPSNRHPSCNGSRRAFEAIRTLQGRSTIMLLIEGQGRIMIFNSIDIKNAHEPNDVS